MYEYLIRDVDLIINWRDELCEKILEEYSDLGWELVQIYEGQVIFKRVKKLILSKGVNYE